MGGNAVPGVSRASPAQYAELKHRIISAMREYFPKVATPTEFPNKSSYGDVDVVYAPHCKAIIRDFVLVTFGPEAADRAVTNGHTVSFPLDNIQVDLIGESTENFAVSVAYYSYGDLGRIMGTMSQFYGLRWGKYGLSIPVNCRDSSRKAFSHPWNLRDNDPIPSDDWNNILTLSTDHADVFAYFGLNAVAFDAGFNDEEEIWNWCISSPYFDISMFQRSIDMLADDSAECDKAKMRPAYRRFLQWAAGNAADFHFKAQLPNPIIYFNKEENISRVVDIHNKHTERKQKYSGRLFVEKGIAQRKIGAAMKWVKRYFDRNNATSTMDEWIDSRSIDEIAQWVDSAIELYKAEAL